MAIDPDASAVGTVGLSEIPFASDDGRRRTATERHVAGHRRQTSARHRCECSLDAFALSPAEYPGFVLVHPLRQLRQVHLEESQIATPETEVDFLQRAQTPHQESSADGQNENQRHFGDHDSHCVA